MRLRVEMERVRACVEIRRESRAVDFTAKDTKDAKEKRRKNPGGFDGRARAANEYAFLRLSFAAFASFVARPPARDPGHAWTGPGQANKKGAPVRKAPSSDASNGQVRAAVPAMCTLVRTLPDSVSLSISSDSAPLSSACADAA